MDTHRAEPDGPEGGDVVSRYDWPAGPESRDDGIGRARYNARFLPAPDVRNADGSLEPIVARVRAVPTPVADPTPAPRRRGRRSPEVAAPPVAGGFVWFPIGPSTLTNGQASGHPSVSGRIRDLAVEPSVGDRVYAASAAGGVWFSGDRGVSWAPLDQFVVSPGRNTLTPVGNALATGAIHVLWGSAADGSADEVFVGTGEPGGDGSGRAGGHIAGIGILHAVGPATGAAWTRPSDTDRLRGASVRRIAEDPLHRFQLLAATSRNMWVRSGAGAWSVQPHLGVGEVLDVAVLRTQTPDRIRVFYALRSRVTAGDVTDLWVAEVLTPPTPPGDVDLSTATVQKVPLVGFHGNSRLRLAMFGTTHLWVLGVGSAKDRPAHLELVDPSADLAALTGRVVSGVPGDLFQSASDQSEYDMALATHPTSADRVYVGGATEMIGGDYNASLYRMEVTGPGAADAVRIGGGVHADVHAITTGPTSSPSAHAIWVGCDGGVFLSDADGDAGSFVARNNALATLQPGFVAGHPTNDGLLAAGFQDNGTSDRVGDTVWRERFEGDGGGVVYDPRADDRYFRQYTAGTWASSDGNGSGPVHRFGSLRAGTEDDQSVFYSGAAALDHGGTVHLAVGTNRLWWSPDWGDSWATVPTGTDPRAALFPDLVQDVLAPPDAPSSECCSPTFTAASGVIACRLAPLPDAAGRNRVRLYALWMAGLSVFEGSRATGSTGAWTWRGETALPIRDARDATELGTVATGAPLAFLPASFTGNDGKHYTFANDMNVHDPAQGPHGSCYVTTVGGTTVDTLWWYDGDGHVVPCGLRTVLPARATWPTEADRIVAPALSVVVDPTDVSIVYVGTSVGVVKGKLTLTAGTPTWTWAVFDNGLPEAAVQDLSVFHDGELTLLRAALQARGVWEVDLRAPVATAQTFLRVHPSDTRRRRTTALTGPPTRGETNLRYDASPDIVVDTTGLTWPAGGPGEGEVFDQLHPGRVAEHASQELATRLFRVHVLVHDRWYAETAPADVKVALLRHEIAAPDADVPLGTLWSVLVNVANGQPVPNPWPGGWLPAGSSPVASITAPLSARIPRAATFDLDLSGRPAGARIMLLAVVMNSGDRLGLAETTMADLNEATTVRQLVLNTRHAAARSLLLR